MPPVAPVYFGKEKKKNGEEKKRQEFTLMCREKEKERERE